MRNGGNFVAVREHYRISVVKFADKAAHAHVKRFRAVRARKHGVLPGQKFAVLFGFGGFADGEHKIALAVRNLFTEGSSA